MNAYVIDTSVAVKWFCLEDDTASALDLRERLYRQECRILAPDLLLYELANALRFNPRLTADDVKAAVGSVVDLGLELISADAEMLGKAVDLALRFDTTVYDACFLALADLRDLPLISADVKLIAQAKGFAGLVRLGSVSL